MSESLRDRVARVLWEAHTSDGRRAAPAGDTAAMADALIAASLVADRAVLIQKSAAMGFDTAIKSLTYSDGTPVDVVSVVNPYRVRP